MLNLLRSKELNIDWSGWMDKLPLGVVPRDIWLELRKQELYQAIKRYVNAGILDDNVRRWHEEHDFIAKELERIRSDQPPEGEKKRKWLNV